MKYFTEIKKDIQDWGDKVFTPDTKKAKDWKDGRSAKALAEFMLKDGEEIIKEEVVKLLREEIEFSYAIPELEVKFDDYAGKGRVHDLGIYGKTKSGNSIFIGVEAKVDESFGNTVSQQYKYAENAYIKNNASKAKKRIEDLLENNSIDSEPQNCNLRYQLLYATSGTVAVEADISILLVLVFKTDKYNEDKGLKNDKDFKDFIKAAKAKEFYKNAYEMNVKYNNKDKKLHILALKIQG